MVYKYGDGSFDLILKCDVCREAGTFLVLVTEAVFIGGDFLDFPILTEISILLQNLNHLILTSFVATL
jgi:hypothetical protein